MKTINIHEDYLMYLLVQEAKGQLHTLVSYMQETYTNETLPKKIILPDANKANNVRVHEYHNGTEIEINELGHTRICNNGLSYRYDVVEKGGHCIWEFNGFKGNETYQYYIEVTHPDYVDNGQN